MGHIRGKKTQEMTRNSYLSLSSSYVNTNEPSAEVNAETQELKELRITGGSRTLTTGSRHNEVILLHGSNIH